MAFCVDVSVKSIVNIFIILCIHSHSTASKDVAYTIRDRIPSFYKDSTVIDIKNDDTGRYRRQVDMVPTTTVPTNDNNGVGMTAAPDNPTEAPTTKAATTQKTALDLTAAPPTTPPTYIGPMPDPSEWNIMHDDHIYYTSDIMTGNVDVFWRDLEDVAGHSTLSNSHRTAVTANFDFKFYGHRITNITIATGGFLYVSPFIHKFLTASQYIAPLMANFESKSAGNQSTILYLNHGFMYMSPFLHQWLTATQYIAPLMANFDTKVGNQSEILYLNNQQGAFIVEWRDVHLQDQNNTGAFRFQTILHSNGSIVFIYKKLPVPVMNISSDAHPVKIGLSDAFYYDTTQFGVKRRTIYEYHRVSLNRTYITEGTVVLIHPRPTCNLATDCEQCINQTSSFTCRWCGIVRRCSDSVDWHRQEWLNAGCSELSGDSNCSAIPTGPPPTSPPPKTSSTTLSSTTRPPPTYKPHPSTSKPAPTSKLPPLTYKPPPSTSTAPSTNAYQTSGDRGSHENVGVIVVVVLIVVILIGGIAGWFFYAYKHPTSPSGMWLMEHRPSQMKAKMQGMKFWKRNSSAGDKYAVESTA